MRYKFGREETVLLGGTVGSQDGRAFLQFGSVQVSDCMVCAEFVCVALSVIDDKKYNLKRYECGG